MRIKLNFVTTMCLLVSPLAIAGAMDGKGAVDKFKSMDTNRDGNLTLAEHSESVKAKFAMMDTNKDGSVTAAEMDAAYDKKGRGKYKTSASEKIAMMDVNSDGALSAEEHNEGAKKMFTDMDSDKNGFVSMAEMQKQ